jgi:hypothetical protein
VTEWKEKMEQNERRGNWTWLSWLMAWVGWNKSWIWPMMKSDGWKENWKHVQLWETLKWKSEKQAHSNQRDSHWKWKPNGCQLLETVER